MKRRRGMVEPIDSANVDAVFNGRAYGGVANRLLANNFNPDALRTNETLLYDEWKLIDKVVLEAALLRLNGVADLNSRGLTMDIPNGLAKTVIQYQAASEITGAEMNMDGISKGPRDRADYNLNYLPLPIIHKDFSFSVRELAESRNGSMPLDTSNAARAAYKVAEKLEELLFLGSGSYSFGGGTIYGYIDTPHRNTHVLSAHWDAMADPATQGGLIIADVAALKQDSIAARHYGPWVLYIPLGYETIMDKDFKTYSNVTIRERILSIEGIEDVKVSDKLTAHNILLVQQTPDVVRMVNGLPIQTVQWDSEGGMQFNFKVMTIAVPQIRQDYANRSGIVHLS